MRPSSEGVGPRRPSPSRDARTGLPGHPSNPGWGQSRRRHRAPAGSGAVTRRRGRRPSATVRPRSNEPWETEGAAPTRCGASRVSMTAPPDRADRNGLIAPSEDRGPVDRHARRRHRSRRRIQGAPRKGPLSARLGRKSCLRLDNPPGRRTHLLRQDPRRSASAVPSRRTQLASLGTAHRPAEALPQTRRPVPHLAAAPDHPRGSRRRAADTDPRPFVDGLAGRGRPASRRRPHSARGDVSDGARRAPPSNSSRNVLLLRNQPESPLPTAAWENACLFACE